jgi:peptidoglycan/xylan/chitin deacetylase (PgdA/CDA1 family)
MRVIGRPGRIGALDRILGTIKAQGGAWIVGRNEIAKHWLKRIATAA